MEIENSVQGIEECEQLIKTYTEEKKTFLRHIQEAKLIHLYYNNKKYEEALTLIVILAKELKKLDDRVLLVDVHLSESKVYYQLTNIPKAKSSLTSARTFASAIYCPPNVQGELDLQSALLYAEEGEFKTAFSYFYETFECFDSCNNQVSASTCLKYMLLCKIMLNLPEEVHTIINSKASKPFYRESVDFMIAVSKSLKNRSLDEFKQTLHKYETELFSDNLTKRLLEKLYDTMLEQNLSKLIEPFSRIEISHLAKLINLPEKIVEEKLSTMILDNKLIAILDQESNCLIVYDHSLNDELYVQSLEMIVHLGNVVDSLYEKAKKLVVV